MRKIRKRIFAASLAAVVVATMLGTASYAESENITENVTEQVETDITEEAEVAEKTEAEVAEETEADVSEETGTDGSGTEEPVADGDELPEEELSASTPKEDTVECACGILCAEDSINGDCPVCGVEGAVLSCCEGEEQEIIPDKDSEYDHVDTEDVEQEDTGEEDVDSSLCTHHEEHTQACGYSKASEDEEGSPCTYECRLCPIEDLIAALPDSVTEDNAETVRVQLEEILSLYTELDEDEQEQIDISRCLELQRELDEANAPVLADDIITTELDFTNVGDGDGQTHAEGSGYKWSGDAESGYLLELDGLQMDLPVEYTPAPGHIANWAIRIPVDGEVTIQIDGENYINDQASKRTVFRCKDYTGNDSVVIQGMGSLTVNTHTFGFFSKDLVMKDVTVRTDSEMYSGIRTDHGDITLENVDFQMKAVGGLSCIWTKKGNMTIRNSKIKLDSNDYPPVYVEGGILTVEDSELDLSSNYHSGIYIATDTPGRSNIFSGKTTVSINCTDSYGIFSKGNLVVETPAKLTATGQTSFALAVFEGIVLDGTAVTSPVDGIITPPGGGSNVYVVRVGNDAVTSVEIAPVELTVNLDNAESKYSYGSSAQATITADASITATVSVYDGEKLLGTANLGEAIPIDTNNLGIGSHTLTVKLQENKGDISKEFTLTIIKAVPIVTGPTASSLQYGQKLSESILSGGTATDSGTGESVEGTWAWKDGNVLPTVENNGYIAIFTPADTDKYDIVETRVALTVDKAQNAPSMPGITMNVPNSIEKLSDISLPEGWEWQESDQDIRLEAGKEVSVVAVYTGADKGNYETETITVTITREVCDHEAGDILYTGEGEKEPTCTENGLGHRECIKCGSIMESGIVTEALGHTGGTATCSQQAVCTRCNQPYGDTDSSRHGDTEIRGTVEATCTADGYTGDTYCKDCNEKIEAGNTTPALGHDYISRVTKEPTKDSEGIRTYTCSRCGDSYTRTIAKLPGDTKPGHTSGTGSTGNRGTGTEAGNGTTQESGSAGQSVQNADTEDDQHPEVWFLQILLACGGIMMILKRRNMN